MQTWWSTLSPWSHVPRLYLAVLTPKDVVRFRLSKNGAICARRAFAVRKIFCILQSIAKPYMWLFKYTE
jgi:hypothetical protein